MNPSITGLDSKLSMTDSTLCRFDDLLKFPSHIDKVIQQNPSQFSKEMLEKLIQAKKITANHISSLAKDNKSKLILLEILNDAFIDDTSVDIFKKTSILDTFIDENIQKANAKIIKKLIDKNLINVELLKTSLNKFLNLQPVLEEELAATCNQPYQNKLLITFFLEAGVKYSKEEINKVAKSGDYLLLKQFLALGADISEAVFALLEYEHEWPLRRLLDGQPPDMLDPNLRNRTGNTLLVEAIKLDKLNLVSCLLSNGANTLILDSHGQSVFDLAREKSPSITKLLYNFQYQKRGVPGWSCASEEIAEEKALKKFLGRKVSGKPASQFYCLFIQINETFLAVLKNSDFSNRMVDSQQLSMHSYDGNLIHSWRSRALYPIPEEFMPNHTSMYTIGFAIIKTHASSPDEFVEVDKKRYRCIRLENTYITGSPDEEYGFKYAYGDVQTHGHGRNPEAARSAFKENRDGIKLNWTKVPELNAEKDSLIELNKQTEKLFEKEQKNRVGLENLSVKINSFMEKAESIIEARYQTASTDETRRREEDELIKTSYTPVQQTLSGISGSLFDETSLGEWLELIRKNLEFFQAFEKKLLAANPMSTAIFENEQKLVFRNLHNIKNLIINRTVTSSEISTLKIYTSSLLVEDIFTFSKASITLIKKTICKLVTTSLQSIPVIINRKLADHFLEKEFRKKRLTQLNEEAQFVIQSALLTDHAMMQDLARELALLYDTSNILSAIPPVSLAVEAYEDDCILQSTMNKLLACYAKAREILDEFWQKTCDDQTLLNNQLDSFLELITKRLLLMDEEIRISEERQFLYPLMDAHHPKRMLDEQLLLLQTTLLTALSQRSPPTVLSSFLQKTIELVQVKLFPALYGTEKKRYKLDGLFLHNIIDGILKIKELVEAAWQSDSTETSPFKPLNDLLQDYTPPKKGETEELLTQFFTHLSTSKPLPDFDPKIKELVFKVQQMQKEIKTLKESFKKTADSSPILGQLNNQLDKISDVMKYLKVGKNTSQVTPSQIWKIFDKSTVSDSEKSALKANFIAHLIESLNNSLNQLKTYTKKLTELEAIEEGKAKSLQEEFATCKKCIQEFLEIEKEALPIDFSQFRAQAIKMIGAIQDTSKGVLEKSLNQIPLLWKKLSEDHDLDINIILDVKKLSEQIRAFLEGKKDKTFSGQFLPHLEGLSQMVEPYLKQALRLFLIDFLKPLVGCQQALYDAYIKKIEKMSGQLSLGIRKQTYYVTSNKNVTYYLWDGKPFIALSYHTDNEVHIPLV